MDTMKAAVVVEPGRLEIREVPIPKPSGPYQALTKQEAASFCSSTDVKIAFNELPFVSEYPCILGHEGLGRVIEPGEKCRHLAVGDRVLRSTCVLPGDKLGDYTSGWGAFAEYGIVTDLQSMIEDLQFRADSGMTVQHMQQVVPADMPATDATMLITLMECLSSLQDAGMCGPQVRAPDKRVLVVGDGAVGLSFAVWAKILGSPRTVIAGHHQSRLDHGLKLGLDAAVNTTGMTLAEAVPGEQFDIIIDAVGDGKIVEQAMAVVAGWGVIAVYGASMKMQSQVDMLAMPVGASLMRATTNEPRAHPQVLAACKLGLVRPKDFYSHVIPLERAAEGVELLRSREALKVVLTME
jgi:threonine dehydrogenase-like Zn-dependent dehydrogenase